MHEKKKAEGNIGRDFPLHLVDNLEEAHPDVVNSSTMDKMGHVSSTIQPEQLELVRRYLRGIVARYREANYSKNKKAPHVGELNTTGFSDYLYFEEMLYSIDLGANGAGDGASLTMPRSPSRTSPRCATRTAARASASGLATPS